MLIIHFFKN